MAGRKTEQAFGALKAKTERDFLYVSSQTSNSSASPNLLEYVGRRLACFDEPSSDGGHKRMDLQKIKELTSDKVSNCILLPNTRKRQVIGRYFSCERPR